jgi:hypothetical protein
LIDCTSSSVAPDSLATFPRLRESFPHEEAPASSLPILSRASVLPNRSLPFRSIENGVPETICPSRSVACAASSASYRQPPFTSGASMLFQPDLLALEPEHVAVHNAGYAFFQSPQIGMAKSEGTKREQNKCSRADQRHGFEIGRHAVAQHRSAGCLPLTSPQV